MCGDECNQKKLLNKESGLMKTQRPPEHHPGTPRRPAPEYSLLGCTNSQLRFTDHGLLSLFYFVDQCLVNEEEEDTEADHGEDRKPNEHDEPNCVVLVTRKTFLFSFIAALACACRLPLPVQKE